MADGSVATCDPHLAAFLIVGAQNWITSWYRADGAWPRESIAAGYADMVRRLLAPVPASPPAPVPESTQPVRMTLAQTRRRRQ